ncbi:MAG: hypothetical protein J5774_02190 [Clostridia bacterium]|nr:hypothetical protein [Clostridia bacterium]
MKNALKALIVALIIIAISAFTFSCYEKPQEAQEPAETTETVKVLDDRFDLTNNVLNFIKDYFYDDIDYDYADLYAAYGLVASLGDYNYIYSPEDLVGSVSDGKGFGLLIKTNIYNEHLIDFILPGSPFLTPYNGNTVLRGDELYAVDDFRISGLSSSAYSAVLNSLPSDRAVKFTMLRGDETFDVVYQKTDITFPSCVYINNLPGVPEEFGYIFLRNFSNTNDVLNEFKAAVRSFNSDGNRALLLDLRGNGGGNTNVLRSIASALIGDAPMNELLFEVHYAKESRSNYIYSTPVENKIDTPIYVLCNSGTASASEALIGTMRAHGTLTALIGQSTVGKGVAQNAFTTYQEGEKGVFIDKGLDENGEEVDLNTHYVQIIFGKYYIYDQSAEGGKYCMHGKPFIPDIPITDENPITPDYGEDLYIHAAVEHYNGN